MTHSIDQYRSLIRVALRTGHIAPGYGTNLPWLIYRRVCFYVVTFCISSIFCYNRFFKNVRGDHELYDVYVLFKDIKVN